MPSAIRFTGSQILGYDMPPFDPIHNAGTLLDVDLAAVNEPTSGVPGDGGWIHNVAKYATAAAIGSTVEAVSVLRVKSTFQQPANGIIERTSKGGLHFLTSKVNDVVGNTYNILMPDPLVAYLNGLGKNRYTYLGVSGKITRLGNAITATQPLVRLARSNSDFRQMVVEGSSGSSVVAVGSSASTTTVVTPGVTTPGLFHSGVTVNNSHSALLSNILTIAGPPTATYLHKTPSWIMYDIYVEDLTLSGLSHAQANAKHLARHTRNHSPGGKFHGDTNTSPTG